MQRMDDERKRKVLRRLEQSGGIAGSEGYALLYRIDEFAVGGGGGQLDYSAGGA